MFEKVNPAHPDKLADAIAGAIVDLAYKKEERPRIAIEVLLGHGIGTCIIESNVKLSKQEILKICHRIAGESVDWTIKKVLQDKHLYENQQNEPRCGDNGIFKGLPITHEQEILTTIAKQLYEKIPYDGKFLINNKDVVVCQSNCNDKITIDGFNIVTNPLGTWTGGINVDSGATNRKLGSDMGDAVSGGGLHGKDLSKADVTLNIICHKIANTINAPVYCSCAIGDKSVKFTSPANDPMSIQELERWSSLTFRNLVIFVREFIEELGGFEEFAKWGLIR